MYVVMDGEISTLRSQWQTEQTQQSDTSFPIARRTPQTDDAAISGRVAEDGEIASPALGELAMTDGTCVVIQSNTWCC